MKGRLKTMNGFQTAFVVEINSVVYTFRFSDADQISRFSGCQECRKARQSRMVLDNPKNLLEHHAARKRKQNCPKSVNNATISYTFVCLITVLKMVVGK